MPENPSPQAQSPATESPDRSTHAQALANEKLALEVEKLRLDVFEIGKRSAAKLELEEKKLQVELEQLLLPWWRKPNYLSVAIPLLVLAGSAVAFVLKYYMGGYDMEQQYLRLEQQRLAIDLARLEQKRDALAKELKELQTTRTTFDAPAVSSAASRNAK